MSFVIWKSEFETPEEEIKFINTKLDMLKEMRNKCIMMISHLLSVEGARKLALHRAVFVSGPYLVEQLYVFF